MLKVNKAIKLCCKWNFITPPLMITYSLLCYLQGTFFFLLSKNKVMGKIELSIMQYFFFFFRNEGPVLACFKRVRLQCGKRCVLCFDCLYMCMLQYAILDLPIEWCKKIKIFFFLIASWHKRWILEFLKFNLYLWPLGICYLCWHRIDERIRKRTRTTLKVLSRN